MHRHGVEVRPRQTSHSVSFVSVTSVTTVDICVAVFALVNRELDQETCSCNVNSDNMSQLVAVVVQTEEVFVFVLSFKYLTDNPGP